MSIAILFVPFATDASSPRKINAGRVKVEPPPALTFKKPATIPTPNKINNDKKSLTKLCPQ